MADNTITKRYDLRTIGVQKVLSDLESVNKQLEKIAQAKKGLNNSKGTTADPAQVAKYTRELEKQLLAEQKLEQQRIKTQREALKLAKDQEALSKATQVQQKAERGSINEAKKIISELTKAKNNLNLSTKEGKKLNEEYNRVIEKQNAFIRKNADEETKRFRNIGNYGTKFKAMIAGLAGGGLALAGASILSGITSSIKNAEEEALQAEKSMRLLRNTLLNMGRESYFDNLIGEADKLAKQFTYLDNDDIVMAQEKLVLYGKVSAKQLHELIRVAVDLSARLGIDMPEATSVLIKALEGNSKPLKEMGINMKDGKDVAERYDIIINQLGTSINGTAEDFAKSSEGMKASARQMRKDLEEEIGNNLLPLLNKFYELTNKAVIGLKFFFDWSKTGQSEMRADVISEQLNLVGSATQLLTIQQKKYNDAVKEGKITQQEANKALERFITNQTKQMKSSLDKSYQEGAFGSNNNFEGTAMARAQYNAFVAASRSFKVLDNNAINPNAGAGGESDEEKKKRQDAEKARTEKINKEKLDMERVAYESSLILLDDYHREVAIRTKKFEDDMKILKNGTAEQKAVVEEAYQKDLSDIYTKYSNINIEQVDATIKKLDDADDKRLEELAKKMKEEQKLKAEKHKEDLEWEEQFNKDLEDTMIQAKENMARIEKEKQDEIYRLRKQAFDGAMQLAEQYFKGLADMRLKESDSAYQSNLKALELEKQKMLAKSGSLAEDQAIEAQYAQKAKDEEKKNNEERQQIILKQLAMEFALASMRALSTSNSVMEGIINMAVVLGTYLMARKNAMQSFEDGGVVPTSTGGDITGPSHSEGGIPFNYEAQGEELAIINKNSSNDKGTYSVTGTPREIASAINEIGGGVSFQRGAKLTKFEYGGQLGRSITAPSFSSTSSAGQTSQDVSAFMGSIMHLNSRIDNLKVSLDISDVRKADSKYVKQTKVGTL